ncbi:MAG: hypothetical protein NZ901_05270 [Geminocystis sp.]|nr:hypothetical protein [Geminocystis sp.]HIK36477.1 hypothetical protein [Geminocystis sp. M7585_C2015_104]MCS7147585.1 hypothetical protein [Geminocystis sp.]MCX8077988.1 hypothetical protein [Geminocystis sp.]MDW8115278.1 hypothetical protein [Geminocystis sp.]
MFTSSRLSRNAATAVAVGLSLSTLVNSFIPVAAKPYKPNRLIRNNSPLYWQPRGVNTNTNTNTYTNTNKTPSASFPTPFAKQAILNPGVVIPTTLPTAKKILVTREETMSLTLVVERDVFEQSKRVIVIPAGSEIVGEIRPAEGGSRFVANKVKFKDGREYPISAQSRVISRTEKVSAGKNTDAIWQGALIGAAAAAVIAAVTGDKTIGIEEILGGAAVGAIGGLVFGGDVERELISINPEEDLDVTLTSPFPS